MCCWLVPTETDLGKVERDNVAGRFKHSLTRDDVQKCFLMLLAAAYQNRPRNTERDNVAGRFKHSLTMTLRTTPCASFVNLVRRCDACTEVINKRRTRHPDTGHASGIKENNILVYSLLKKTLCFTNARTRGPSGMARHRVFSKFPQRDRHQQRSFESPGIRGWMKRCFLMCLILRKPFSFAEVPGPEVHIAQQQVKTAPGVYPNPNALQKNKHIRLGNGDVHPPPPHPSPLCLPRARPWGRGFFVASPPGYVRQAGGERKLVKQMPAGAFVEGVGKLKLILLIGSPGPEVHRAIKKCNQFPERGAPAGLTLWRRSPQEHPGNLRRKLLLLRFGLVLPAEPKCS